MESNHHSGFAVIACLAISIGFELSAAHIVSPKIERRNRLQASARGL